MSESIKAKKLFICIGEIDDAVLEEAEAADIPAETVTARKRYVKYGTLAAAASFGVAVTTYLLLRYRRVSANVN
ncbi:MAG: hypothetical protein LBE55_00020 [Clostridiales bacterium]|jgi:hypothetical protein|nr:hypothetical protein [Clostridiales bacterium]